MNGFTFDLGGTKLRVAATDGRRLERFLAVPTPHRYAAGLQAFRVAARAVLRGRTPTRVAGGVPGVLDPHRQRLVRAPHLPGWVGQSLARDLTRVLGAPVQLENDAALAGLGEATRGAGQGSRIVAYLTVSTGVGGSRIVDGRIDERRVGFEPGHMVLDRGRTLEELVSGSAFAQRYHRSPKTVRNRRVWQATARWLGVGLANLSLLWSPDVIVLGGSMFHQPGIRIADVRSVLRRELTIFPTPPALKPAQLKDRAALWGAASLLTR